MKVADLIRQSALLANAIAANAEMPAFYQTQGLYMLNEIISMFSGLSNYLSYYSTLTVNLVENQYEYIVYPIVAVINEVNMRDINNTLYVLSQASDAQFNTFDFINIISIPQYVYLSNEKVIDQGTFQEGSKLYFYPTPSASYTANLMVKNQLNTLTLDQDLSQFPGYAIRYLRHLLAKDYINIFKTVPSDSFYADLKEIEYLFKRTNKKDLSVKNSNAFYRNYMLRPKNYYVG